MGFRQFVIAGRLAGLNAYTKSQRGGVHSGAGLKRIETYIVEIACMDLDPVPDDAYPVTLSILWCEKNKRRDPDNIVFAKKFILDGLQKAGVIRNDGWGEVSRFEEEWIVDKEYPRVEVSLRWD